jgi:superfamily II DNA or RNA helicase
MAQCKLIVRDAVNVRFEGLDANIRKQMTDTLKFVIPSARHTPQYKLGRWDGTVSFCSPAGSTFLNLLDRLLPILEAAHITIEVDDRRPFLEFAFRSVSQTMFAHRTWPLGHDLAGQPIILRDYQVEALQTFRSNLQALQMISTGAGKTVITAALSWLIEPYGRSIVIVPSKTLVTQTEADYRNLGLDVGVFFGDRKEWGHQHTICTWQSLAVFSKKNKRGEAPTISIMKFIEGVVGVIIDESHAAKANVLRNLLSGPFAHVPIRWGLTGTIPKAEHEAISLLATIGPLVGELRASELQEQGVLANCHVTIVQTQEEDLEFPDYDTEHKYLVTDPARLRHLAKKITEWSEAGNTLVLIDRIPTGKTLLAMLKNASFVFGKTKGKTRQAEYSSIQTESDKIIIATYGVAAVGINIPRIFNIVLLEAGKSFIRVIQSIGRGLRKTQDKNKVEIYDVCSTLKFSRRHVLKRKEYYREAEYPFNLMKIKF